MGTRGSSVPLAPQLSYLPKRLVVHFGMRLRLRDNSEVLALGGAVTGVRVYCVVVACRNGDALPDTVELVPFTSVADIMGHSDADVGQAARAYKSCGARTPCCGTCPRRCTRRTGPSTSPKKLYL